MTRRERKEAKMQRRLDWAKGREDKATVLNQYTDRYRGDIAFNTQPGHIPERARVIRMSDKAHEHAQMAAHHESKAAGIAHQLERSIFTDDRDAPERLRERIAGLEAERERMKAVNAEIKRGEGWEQRLSAAAAPLTEREKKLLLDVARFQPYYCKNGVPVFPPYAFTNLSGNIRRLKGRLVAVDTLAAQRAKVADVLAKEGGNGPSCP